MGMGWSTIDRGPPFRWWEQLKPPALTLHRMGDDMRGWAAREYPTLQDYCGKWVLRGGVSSSLGGRDWFLVTSKKRLGSDTVGALKKNPIKVVLFLY